MEQYTIIKSFVMFMALVGGFSFFFLKFFFERDDLGAKHWKNTFFLSQFVNCFKCRLLREIQHQWRKRYPRSISRR